MGIASVNLHFARSHRESQTLTHSQSSIHISNIVLPTLNSSPSVWIRTAKNHVGLRERYIAWIPPTEKFYPQYRLAYFSLD